MLDLSTIKVEYFDVKLPDGRILNIRKPSKAMYDWLVNLSKDFAKMTEKQIENSTYDYALRILNRNVNDIEFTKEWLKENLKIEICDQLILEYVKFTNAITNNPN